MKLKNSVVVDLDKYNELRDFKRAIEDDRVSVINRNVYGGISSYYYLSYEEAVIELTKINEGNEKIYSEKISNLNENIYNLESEIKILKSPIKEPIRNNLDELKKLSLIELIKWYFKK